MELAARHRRPALAALLILGPGVLAAGPAAKPKAPPSPLDQALLDYRKKLAGAVGADLKRYDELRRGAPRATIQWQGVPHRYPPIPEPDPGLGELQAVLPLSALPGSWIEPLNQNGAQLFEKGMKDGRAGKPSAPWNKYQPHLEDRDFAPRPIHGLVEIFPEYAAKTDYKAATVPFEKLAAARKKLEGKLAAIPGSARGEIAFKDDDPKARETIELFEAFQEEARQVAMALRAKVLGQAKRELIDLSTQVFGAARAKLGKDPEAKDYLKVFEILPPRWKAMLERHHAERYFSGYNAVKSLASGGGTGDGTGKLPEGTTGTGSGEGSGGLAIQGGGTGTGETSGAPLPGGGTGDGHAAVDETEPGTGTGSGTSDAPSSSPGTGG